VSDFLFCVIAYTLHWPTITVIDKAGLLVAISLVGKICNDRCCEEGLIYAFPLEKLKMNSLVAFFLLVDASVSQRDRMHLIVSDFCWTGLQCSFCLINLFTFIRDKEIDTLKLLRYRGFSPCLICLIFMLIWLSYVFNTPFKKYIYSQLEQTHIWFSFISSLDYM